MEEPYRKEFGELSALAEKQLQYSEVHLPHHKRLFRIWRYPSFEPSISWIVFAPIERYAKVDLPMVVEVKWNRPFDAMRFHEPMKGLAHGLSIAPTLSLRSAPLSRDQLGVRIASLEKIKVPWLSDGSIGVDGESCGFETFAFAATVSITWWSTIPEGWQPMADWAEDTRQFLNEALDSGTLRDPKCLNFDA